MTSVGRVDQAILLLQERLKKLDRGNASRRASSAAASNASENNALLPLAQLVRQRQIGDEDLHKALVRTLLADTLGDDLVASLEFQSIADEVTRILEDSDAGRSLINRVLSELA